MLKFLLCACAGLLAAAGMAVAQQAPASQPPPGNPIPSGSSQPDTPAALSATAQNNTDLPAGQTPGGNPAAGEAAPSAVSSNPAANDIFTGTGALGRFLGFDKDSGVRLGGAWIGDSNWLMSGGREPGEWSLNSLLLLDLTLDADKLMGIKGGMFGIQFLQFDGQPTNQEAGVVQGYNSLPGAPPLERTELYELWWRQKLFDDKLTLRIGKTVPTYDFNNVSRPAPRKMRTPSFRPSAA